MAPSSSRRSAANSRRIDAFVARDGNARRSTVSPARDPAHRSRGASGDLYSSSTQARNRLAREMHALMLPEAGARELQVALGELIECVIAQGGAEEVQD